MNQQLTNTQANHYALPTTCSCCAQAQPLIAQGAQGQPVRWAACANTGLWHENRGDGVFVLSASTPNQQNANAINDWQEGGSAPVLAPSVRIDLSRDSYA